MDWLHRTRRVARVVAALLILLLVAGCSGDGEALAFEPIPPRAFPQTPGRGFPVAQLAPDAGQAKVGEEAPNFAFVLESGEGASLADLRGRPVILNFWASWCGPCRLEMPDLVALHETNEEVIVLEVNVKEDLSVIEPFVEEFDMTMPVVRDQEGDLQRAYAVLGLPVTVFIDADGTIDSRWDGILNAELLAERVAALE